METINTLRVVRITTEHQEYLQATMELVDIVDGGPTSAHLQKLLADDRTYLLAALLGEEVIGLALAYRFPSLYSDAWMACLYDIDVVAKYKRRGAGRLLVETMKAEVKQDGVNELWLGTGTENAEGQGLYTATGGAKNEETFNDYTYYLYKYTYFLLASIWLAEAKNASSSLPGADCG